MKKIDYKVELAEFYKVSAKQPVVVKMPQFNYLMIDGKGDPNTSKEYADAVKALFSLAYAIKFFIKKSELALDFGVMPLEGLWWAEDMSVFTSNDKKDNDKSNWLWTMMIMQPGCVTRKIFEQMKAQVAEKKNLPSLDKIRFEKFKEGTCAQILHVGPFSEEGPTIERVHQFILEQGSLSGKHHEIYLSDIRKAAPDKWKTIIRQPFSK